MAHSPTVTFACLLAWLPIAIAQPPSSEMTSRDESATFRTSTNMVLVPVVVRDGKGHPVGDLKREDFQLFDRGKLQVISKFSLEKRDASVALPPEPGTVEAAGASDSRSIAASAVPEHFFAYLFDDIHLQQADLQRVRDAAAAHITGNLGPKDRAAIFSTSGQAMLDFTGDRAKLLDTLYRLLAPHPIAESHPCPDINYFWARLIRDHDHEAWYYGMLETMGCTNMIDERIASGKLEASINSAINMREQEIRAGFTTLKDLVRRISVMPGQRTIVLISPGFLSHDVKLEENEAIDQAIRSKVVINSLDGRSLYTENRDTDRRPISIPQWADPANPRRFASLSDFVAYKEDTEHQTVKLQEDVLGEVAYGTGGTFFHNSNDLAEGFRQVAAVPEYSYILGFSPEDIKFDGAFHALKVTVKNHGAFDIDARKGYSAPKSITDPAEIAKEQIRGALFSRDEMRAFPIELHTEYFKLTSQAARLSVVAHIDLRPLKFRKEEGRNRDDLTVLAGLFDRNGVYLSGMQKAVDLHLLDANLERWLRTGINVPTSFEVKSGTYLLRLVVRDANGQSVAAQNGVVEIP